MSENKNSPTGAAHPTQTLTLADFGKYDWQPHMNAARTQECDSYNSIFKAKRDEVASAKDAVGTWVYLFLQQVTSYYLNCDATTDVFKPMMIDYANNTRTPLPDDFTENELDIMVGLLPGIKYPEMQARIADTLWERRRDHKAAQVAVDAYIQSALNLDNSPLWPPICDRLDRAIQIGILLGRNKEWHIKALSAIETTIDRHASTDETWLCGRLIRLLQKHKAGEPAKYSGISEKIARRLEEKSDWGAAREYWQLKVFWERRTGQEEEARNAEIMIANCYIKQADGLMNGQTPSYLGAMSWLAKAVQALRQAKAEKTLIEETHQKLLECQRLSVKEFKPFWVSYDSIPGMRESLEKAAEESIAHVKGLGLHDALTRFVSVARPTNPDEIKKRIDNTKQTSILASLFGSVTVREDGQVSGVKPALISDDPKQRVEALTKEMYSQAAQVDWRMAVGILIIPALETLQAEHAFRILDLEYIVQNNPFVPPGREDLYLRGLHAGFHGDYTLAMHLLLPQLENSLRHYFTALGIITSKLESDQTQDEHDLGWLLCHPKMAEMFTPGMAFDLRGLLVERFGFNLRNEIAHGFLDADKFSNVGSILAWWLILRLCYIPVIQARRDAEPGVPSKEGNK